MRFVRIDTPTVMSGLVVRYRLEGEWYDRGEISASRDGVVVQGRFPMMTTEDVVTFEETLARARVHAQHLHHDYDSLFGPRIEALTEEAIDRILGPIPSYEATE